MKIAIFSPYSYPELGACSMRIDSFKNYFESLKHEVKVFSPKRENALESKKNYMRYTNTSDAFRIAFNEKFDVIIGTGPPLTHSFFALLGAKLKGIPFIIDLRDPWTHSYSGLGIYKKTNFKLWAYKSIEFISYNLCDKIFAVTKEIGNIAKKYTFNKNKISIVWNGTDPKLFIFDSKKRKKIRKQLGIPQDAKTGIYAGAFIQKDVDVMIEKIAGTMKKTNMYLMLVISAGNRELKEYNNLKKIVKKNGIEKQTIFINSKKFGFEKLYEYYSAADFGLNPLPKGMDDYCIPVKTYDFFANSLPVIAKGNSDGALAKIITLNKIGWFDSTWEGFAKNLETALKSNELIQIGKNARLKTENIFDRKYSNEKAMKIIKELTTKSKGY